MVGGGAVGKVVRPTTKGQITIPAEFRSRLGIGEDTLLLIKLEGDRIEITPLELLSEGRAVRSYSRREIDEFLEEDRLDPKTAKKVRALLGG